MSETTRATLLVTVLTAALLAGALQAGLYYAFSVAVVPGLRRGDDRTFIATMQQVNVAIINPWFLLTFLGAPVLALVAALLGLGQRPVLVWSALGFVFAAATFLITVRLNVPLNNALAAAGDPGRIADPAGVRAAFDDPWLRWNTVRAVTSTLGVGCLALALALRTP